MFYLVLILSILVKGDSLMFNIEKSDIIYRSIKEPFEEGILACGFMKKPTSASSQINFSNSYYSCFIVLSGTGFYSDSKNNKIPLGSGDFVQRIPGQLHSTEIVPDGNWVEFFVSFGKPVFDYLCKLDLLKPNTPVQTGSPIDSKVISGYYNFLNQLKTAEAGNLDEMLLIAQKLVLNMSRHLPNVNARKQNSTYQLLITEACEIMVSNFQEDIDYSILAESLNMSFENFRKIFKSFMGISPGKYRTVKKIEQAGFMIKSGLSIKEVAYLSGYSDVFAFSKQFKKTMGISPGKF